MSRGFGTDKDQARYKKRLDNLLRLPENKTCCECGQRQPQWASVNLGVFFCIRCSGIHRNLGVHISIVRSITLDSWKQEWVDTLERIGNAKGNQYWEAKSPGSRKPDERVSDHVLEQFIRDKYIKGLWKAADSLESQELSSPQLTQNSSASSSSSLQRPSAGRGPVLARPQQGGAQRLLPPGQVLGSQANTTVAPQQQPQKMTSITHDPFESITTQSPQAKNTSQIEEVDFDTFFSDDTSSQQQPKQFNSNSIQSSTSTTTTNTTDFLFSSPQTFQQPQPQQQQQQQQQQQPQQTDSNDVFAALTNKPSSKDQIMSLYSQPPQQLQPQPQPPGGHMGFNGVPQQSYPNNPHLARHHQQHAAAHYGGYSNPHQMHHQQAMQYHQMQYGQGTPAGMNMYYQQQQQQGYAVQYGTTNNGGVFSQQYSYNSVHQQASAYSSKGGIQTSATMMSTSTQTSDVFDGLF